MLPPSTSEINEINWGKNAFLHPSPTSPPPKKKKKKNAYAYGFGTEDQMGVDVLGVDVLKVDVKALPGTEI